MLPWHSLILISMSGRCSVRSDKIRTSCRPSSLLPSTHSCYRFMTHILSNLTSAIRNYIHFCHVENVTILLNVFFHVHTPCDGGHYVINKHKLLKSNLTNTKLPSFNVLWGSKEHFSKYRYFRGWFGFLMYISQLFRLALFHFFVNDYSLS